MPFLMMYNKYESKLRVFILLKDYDGYNSALIRFYFGQEEVAQFNKTYKSGMFDYTRTPINAIDNISSEPVLMEIPNEYKNAGFT